ncbi:MAG: hypothetical protein LLF76_00280 [Planctomycetaceae bacterium]|nr:hypothetical protein [Planctomycetaceae bacterium]
MPSSGASGMLRQAGPQRRIPIAERIARSIERSASVFIIAHGDDSSSDGGDLQRSPLVFCPSPPRLRRTGKSTAVMDAADQSPPSGQGLSGRDARQARPRRASNCRLTIDDCRLPGRTA